MITHPLLAVGVLLILGWTGGRASNALGLPRVTGYLLAGLLLGPSIFNLFPRRLIDKDLYVITEMALGIIAYSIGGSLVYQRLQRLGRSIVWITFTQAVGAFVSSAVFLSLLIPVVTNLRGVEFNFWNTSLPLALIIGAISVATAPGAVLAIISEFKASGPFTTTLLGVIAIDDALAIMFFALAEAGARSLVHPLAPSWIQLLSDGFLEIVLSLALGLAAGFLLEYLARIIRRREALLMVILGGIFSVSGLATIGHLSPLLANMALGCVIVNRAARHHDFFLVVEQIEEPLYGLFFALAGAHLNLSVLKFAGVLAVAILVFRILGKQAGVWVGALMSQAPAVIRKYLGLGLFPQAGVSIGLVLMAGDIFPDPLVTSLLLNGVIGAVIINELIAPPLVKYALVTAGETSLLKED
jgi:Kef-type K+ transport system membrane component KefB